MNPKQVLFSCTIARMLAVAAVPLLLGGTACSKVKRNTASKAVPLAVVRTFPHDPQAFTQGLVFHDGYLYEGTGLKGHSQLRKVSLEDGTVVQSIQLDPSFFGEGLTILGDRAFQLTWQEKTCFVYDVKTLEQVNQLTYDYEGWGITDNEELLIISDGTPTIRFVSPQSFELVREIEVRSKEGRIGQLNELEWINGEIWANIWKRDRIARINAETGSVLGWLDAGQLHPIESRGKDEVLNGIAYDTSTGRIFVTGKNWPQLFEVRIDDKK